MGRCTRITAHLAVLLLTGLVNRSPAQSPAVAVLEAEASALVEAGRFEEAIARYTTITQAFPDPAIQQHAQYAIATIYALFLEDQDKALQVYEEMVAHFLTDSPTMQKALHSMGRIYMERGQGDLAYQAFRKIRPESEFFAEVQTLSAWMSSRFRRTLYWNGEQLIIIIGILEIAFTFTKLFIMRMGIRRTLLRDRLVKVLYVVLVALLCMKAYFNYTLYLFIK